MTMLEDLGLETIRTWDWVSWESYGLWRDSKMEWNENENENENYQRFQFGNEKVFKEISGCFHYIAFSPWREMCTFI